MGPLLRTSQPSNRPPRCSAYPLSARHIYDARPALVSGKGSNLSPNPDRSAPTCRRGAESPIWAQRSCRAIQARHNVDVAGDSRSLVMLAWVGGSKRRLRSALTRKPRVKGVTDSTDDHQDSSETHHATAGGRAPRAPAAGKGAKSCYQCPAAVDSCPVCSSSTTMRILARVNSVEHQARSASAARLSTRAMCRGQRNNPQASWQGRSTTGHTRRGERAVAGPPDDAVCRRASTAQHWHATTRAQMPGWQRSRRHQLPRAKS